MDNVTGITVSAVSGDDEKVAAGNSQHFALPQSVVAGYTRNVASSPPPTKTEPQLRKVTDGFKHRF